MLIQTYIPKSGSLIFYGYKIKAPDIKSCLTKLTDLSGALHSFSIRVIRSERPRRKLIIDVEMAEGFDPGKYNADSYLYELISSLKKISRNFREFIRNIPAESFPELYFHPFRQVCFARDIFQTRQVHIF